MKKTISIALISGAVLTAAMPSVMAANVDKDNSVVTGKAVAGEYSIEADSVDLGKLEIGQPINSVNGEVRVTDHSGGSGWIAQVKSTNYDVVNKSLVESVQLTGDDKQFITGSDVKVAKGSSLLEKHKINAEYSAEWGVAPEVGNQTNNLTWTLSPRVSTMADDFKENVVFGYQDFLGPKGAESSIDLGDWDSKLNLGMGAPITKIEGMYGKINEKNELNMTFDLSSFTYENEEQFKIDTLSQIESLNNYREMNNLPLLTPTENLKWASEPGMGVDLTATWPIGYEADEFVDYSVESSGEDGDFIVPSSMNTPQGLALTTNEEPELSYNLTIPFVDGSKLTFKYNIKYIGEPTLRK